MPPPQAEDQRIIDEYSALLDRSQQLFSGLRWGHSFLSNVATNR